MIDPFLRESCKTPRSEGEGEGCRRLATELWRGAHWKDSPVGSPPFPGPMWRLKSHLFSSGIYAEGTVDHHQTSWCMLKVWVILVWWCDVRWWLCHSNGGRATSDVVAFHVEGRISGCPLPHVNRLCHTWRTERLL